MARPAYIRKGGGDRGVNVKRGGGGCDWGATVLGFEKEGREGDGTSVDPTGQQADQRVFNHRLEAAGARLDARVEVV